MKNRIKTLIFSMAALLGTVSCAAQQEAPKKAFKPDNASISQHEVPAWYQDAKLGIFIHWGLYSVPGWAKATELTLEETLEKDGGLTWFKENPYAEWYLNSLKIDGSATQEYHRENYGEDYSYYDFVQPFNKAVADWDPQAMANLFKEAGAGYVVLTTKHHDGFLLWPSEHENPFRENYYASRDIVGELTSAVSDAGMKMGLYYSSGLDWTFNDKTITSLMDLFTAIPQDPAYAKYIDQHWRELMERYDPYVLWADIGSPQAYDPVPLIADFYNKNPEGVVNNRHKMEITPTGFGSPIHHDILTPEYTVLDSISEKKWETCRGIGLSFGYNRREDVADFLSIDDLIDSFVDIVSKNGNLLLNVGPKADGSIPEGQRTRLEGLGRWLKQNGEAIYGTRPWKIAAAQTTEGTEVCFTAKGDAVYLTLLDRPEGSTVSLQGLPIESASQIESLATGKAVRFNLEAGDLQLNFDEPESEAYTFRITVR
ncbi:alpha-L-fucosidase [Phaeodactylibacter xiamenensis]|uniref:alpha-L-fucosidase n=1 Tax=Phaeodactylibacter xiamenensis TaxID=1524460 RepID=UPI003CCC3A22